MLRIFNLLGLILLVGAFVAAATQVSLRSARELNPNLVTIRFCHWQLEGGLREAFDVVAAEYERTHTNTRVIQIPVPGRFYGTYTRTQLTGDDPPDIMELGGVPEDWLANYFLAITSYAEKPNPYNAGTPLETLPWRDTFLNGMNRASGSDPMLDYYCVPVTIVSSRMYYNKKLYHEVTGRDQPPGTLDEFDAFCRQTQEYARRTGAPLHPVAGSRFTANIQLDRLMRGQTQRLAMKIDPLQSLTTPGPDALLTHPDILDDPAVRSGLTLMRNAALEMPQGFLQFDRDDAIFHFSQQRAVMLPTGSWDYQSIASQSTFPIGVFAMPQPDPADPRFKPFMLGPASEVTAGTGGYLVSSRSRHPAAAIDFLQFLTSYRGNQLFVNRSKWIPAVVGCTVPEEVRPFAPVIDGYPDGFQIAPIMWGSGDVYRLQSNSLHLLVEPDGSVDKFLAAMKAEFRAALSADVKRLADSNFDTIRRLDSLQPALLRAGESAARISTLRESQNSQEVMLHFLRQQLASPRTNLPGKSSGAEQAGGGAP